MGRIADQVDDSLQRGVGVDASGFEDSQRFIAGSSFTFGPLWIALEWLHGKHDPYIGGGSYTQSLGAGGSDRWENQLYSNVGYYF